MMGFNLSVLVSTVLTLAAPNVSFAAPEPGPFGTSSVILNPLTAQKPKAAITNSATTATTKPPAQSSAVSPNSKPKFTCADLRRAALNMSAHASNLANRSTTRTAEGGPYRRLEVVCKAGGAFCNIEKNEEERTELQPGHPDANSQGYVRFPNISASSESAGLNMAASELKLLASQGVCGAKIIEQGTLSIVKYDSDFDVMMDTMSLNADGNISRWSRTTREGKTQNLSFQTDGTPVAL